MDHRGFVRDDNTMMPIIKLESNLPDLLEKVGKEVVEMLTQEGSQHSRVGWEFVVLNPGKEVDEDGNIT